MTAVKNCTFTAESYLILSINDGINYIGVKQGFYGSLA